MSTFYTRFHKVPREVDLYDPFDKVDRLTYLDTTVQITRMMQAGVNLAFRREQGLPYDGSDDFDPSVPVFPIDPAISAQRMKEYRQALKDRAEAKREQQQQQEPPAATGDGQESAPALT